MGFGYAAHVVVIVKVIALTSFEFRSTTRREAPVKTSCLLDSMEIGQKPNASLVVGKLSSVQRLD